MGLISTTCNVCEQKVGLNRFKIKAGWICPKCLKKVGGFLNFENIRKLPVEEIRDFIDNQPKVTCNVCEQEVGLHFYFFEIKAGWICPKCVKKAGGLSNFENIRKLPVKEIRDFISANGPSPNEETIRRILQEEDNSTGFRLDIHISAAAAQVKPNKEIVYAFAGLATNWDNATSVAIVTSDGNIQIASKGLVTGTNLKIFKFTDIREFTMLNEIITNNICVETLTEHFCINVSSGSKLQRIYDKLSQLHQEFIENKEKKNSIQSKQPISIADELTKFKQLLDAEVITQDEFEKMKKDLLG